MSIEIESSINDDDHGMDESNQDVYWHKDGEDDLDGGQGDDHLYGGAGNDTLKIFLRKAG